MLKPPPESNDGLRPEFPIRQAYYNHFEDFYNKIETLYKSRFIWFIDDIRHVDKIVNVGFGKGGAETFALMWAFSSIQAIGIDLNNSRVRQALNNRQSAEDLVKIWVPTVLRWSSNDYKEEFICWYRTNVKKQIRDLILPDFILGDVSQGLPLVSDYCHVCYSRYMLDKIITNRRRDSVIEMIRIVRPGGYLIIVAPENDFSFDLSGLELELIKSASIEQLGDIEWEENPPVGKLFRKFKH